MRMTLANLPSKKIPQPRMWEINFSAEEGWRARENKNRTMG